MTSLMITPYGIKTPNVQVAPEHGGWGVASPQQILESIPALPSGHIEETLLDLDTSLNTQCYSHSGRDAGLLQRREPDER
jgi:hypothetical protein